MDHRSAEKRKAAEWRAYWASEAGKHGAQRAAERVQANYDSIGPRYLEVNLELQWRRIHRIRVARDDPKWRPSGVLSGGGWLSERYGDSRCRRYFRMLRGRPQRWRRTQHV